jgi:hypothetical protein
MRVKVFDLNKKFIKFQNFQIEWQRSTDSQKPNVVVMFNIGEYSQKLINEMKLMGYTCEKYSLLNSSSSGSGSVPLGEGYLIFVNGLYRIDNSIQVYSTTSVHKTFVHYKLKTDDAKVYDFITTVFDDRIGIRNQQLRQLANFASSCENSNVVVASLSNILPQHETTLFILPGYYDCWFEKGVTEDIIEDVRSARLWSSKLENIVSYSETYKNGEEYDELHTIDEDFKTINSEFNISE